MTLCFLYAILSPVKIITESRILIMKEVTETKNKPKFTTYSLVLMALFAAVLCVSAYISIPLPNGSHITLLNFVVTLISLIFPLSEAFFIVLVWMLLGLCGVPVFIAGNAGPGYLFGQYGGFAFSFILVAILVPLFRGAKYNRIRYTIVSVISVCLVDVIGSFWIMFMSGCSIKTAFVVGFLPFIVLDLIKAVVAAQIVPPFRKLIYMHRADN